MLTVNVLLKHQLTEEEKIVQVRVATNSFSEMMRAVRWDYSHIWAFVESW